jgi:hypothetical protein
MIRIFRHTICVMLAVVALAATATPANAAFITTLYAQNNNGLPGGAIYFDINVLQSGGITIQQIDTNTAASGFTITLDVYTRAGTHVGNEGSLSGWTLVSSGTGLAAGLNNPSMINVSDFSLGLGVTGIALVAASNDWAHHYTNGTGSNQLYSNSDVALSHGSATNAPFDGITFTPRVWNGTLHYSVNELNPVPAPPAAILFAIGAVGLAGGRALRRRLTPVAA